MYVFMQLILISFLWITVFMPGYADESGLKGFSGNPHTNSGVACDVCHVPAGAKPLVSITGPTTVMAGQTYTYTVTVRGGSGVVAGVDIAADKRSFYSNPELPPSDNSGILAPVDDDLKRIGTELTHQNPKTMQSKLAGFKFNWTAPTNNNITYLSAAAISANGLHNLFGDSTGTASLFVKVVNGGQEKSSPPSPKTPANIILENYAQVSLLPTAITHAKDSRLFIASIEGSIWIVKGQNNVLSKPFLDIRNKVQQQCSEQGLLGLAFDPNYATNGYFYVHYNLVTNLPENCSSPTKLFRSRISRFTRNRVDPNSADLSSEMVIMEFTSIWPYHKGGDIHFGPDGYLYIASGDGGGSGQQNFGNLLGKILRIDVNNVPDVTNGPDCDVSGKSNYRIPVHNAFADGKGGQGCDEIYALGLRNPWRFSFDRGTGNLWIGDVGGGLYEEVDVIPAGASGGLNLGWSCFEGFDILDPISTPGCNRSYMFPVYNYSHREEPGYTAIIGGFVYRGLENPGLRGVYVFTSNTLGGAKSWIRTLTGINAYDALSKDNSPLHSATTFGEDSKGELYVGEAGMIYKIKQAVQ